DEGVRESRVNPRSTAVKNSYPCNETITLGVRGRSPAGTGKLACASAAGLSEDAMRRTDRRGALWLGCLGLMWPGVAAGRSVVVVPLAAGEGVTPEEAQSVGDVLAAAIRERGHEVLGPADATRALDRDEPGCVASRRPSCWARGARTLGSDVVVSGR